MSGQTIKLTGWKAVVAIVALGGFIAFRVTTARAKLDTQGRAALELWVQSELLRPILADTTRSLAEQGAAALQASSVKIRSLAVRGSLDHAVARVELAPSPALPPGTDMVRYYRVSYTRISGWTHRGSATVLNWYLAAF